MDEFMEDYMFDEESEEQKEFEITDAQTANWAINKIAEEKKRTDYFVECAKQEIEKLKTQIEEAEERYERSTQFLSGHLGKYLEKEDVPKKKTKTQESVTLPAGKIVKKFPKVEFFVGNKEASKGKENPDFVKEILDADNSFIETKYSVKWADLKKNLVVNEDGDVLMKDSGVFLDSVRAEKTLPTIEIKPNE